ncbi:RIIA lysis inhibitor [Serratia phage 92A1]|nr:RIIA lysis inhibitor [Serratia phage 92A1]
MKLHTDDEVTIGSNTGSSSKFKIAQSAKAFKILSSNLYKHKIRAVIRELACNACDAHVLAGHTKNFNVTLPTMLDPRFIVRDFGPGLDHEDVMNLYTTYFASTKSNSNDFIGALGLGSKSPFSYTETFSVVSNHNSVARGYTAFLDNGEPNLIETFSEPTDEPSGIEITVPAKENDLQKFRNEAMYLFRSFNNIKPTVINLPEDSISLFPEDEYFTGRYGFEENGFYAIMGNIVYPIQKEVVPNSWMRIIGGVHYFRFPLGELDITPSREELSLDEQTVANIEARVTNRDKIVAKEVVDKILAIDNPRKLAMHYNSQGHDQKRWLDQHVVHPLTADHNNSLSALSNFYNTSHIRTKHPIYEICDQPRMMYAKSTWNSRCSPTEITGMNVEAVTVLIDDKPSKRVQFARGLHESGYKKSRYIILIDESNPEHLAALESLRKAFPGTTYNEYRGSDAKAEAIVKLAPAKVKPNAGDARPKYSNVQKWTYNTKYKAWDSEDLFLSANEARALDGYAVLRNRDDISSIADVDQCFNYYNFREALHLIDTKVVYIVRGAAHKYVKESKYKCAIEAITQKFVELIDDTPYESYGFTLSDTFYDRVRANKMAFIEQKLIGCTDMSNYSKLRTCNDLFYSYQISSDASLAKKIFTTLQEDRNKDMKDAVNAFKVKNEVIYRVVVNSYSLPDEVIKNINELVK